MIYILPVYRPPAASSIFTEFRELHLRVLSVQSANARIQRNAGVATEFTCSAGSELSAQKALPRILERHTGGPLS
jgi:hypothetical protein